MKKICLILYVAITSSSFAQQNTTPTNGNVELGTMTPSAKLDENGKANIDSSLTVNDIEALVKSNFPALIGHLYQIKECSPEYLNNPYWMNGPNKLFTRCPEINVGIGTTTPDYTLDVRGTGYFENSVQVGTPFNASLPAYFEGYASLANSRPWMRFSTDENGNTKTAFLVEKNGNVFCTALRVRFSSDIPVPDFVFKSDYELMPLKDLKQFVNVNSHLPNVPSEAEIREKGLNVEEMQLKLLEKVEELTLYVIRLEEQRIEQSVEILELQKEISGLKSEIKLKN